MFVPPNSDMSLLLRARPALGSSWGYLPLNEDRQSQVGLHCFVWNALRALPLDALEGSSVLLLVVLLAMAGGFPVFPLARKIELC